VIHERDGRTDGHCMTAKTAPASHRAVKTEDRFEKNHEREGHTDTAITASAALAYSIARQKRVYKRLWLSGQFC